LDFYHFTPTIDLDFCHFLLIIGLDFYHYTPTIGLDFCHFLLIIGLDICNIVVFLQSNSNENHVFEKKNRRGIISLEKQ
jgi:hypothetical protein